MKKKLFLSFCLCIFESDAAKSHCPAQVFRKMMKYINYLIQTAGFTLFRSFTFFFLEILKKKSFEKKALKMTSQLFFRPPTLNLKKIPVNQLMKKFCPKYEPVHEISNNVVCATSKASDQPAHTRSLIRAFASRLNII